MPKKKKSSSEKHGTRKYQKDTGGPSWDAKRERPPDTEELMAIIERSEEDLDLYRKFLVIIANDPSMSKLSLTEQIDMAEMCMIQEKINRWMLAVDSPDRMEEIKEANKMLRSIWQIKAKMMKDAADRDPFVGAIDGLSKILDEVEEDGQD